MGLNKKPKNQWIMKHFFVTALLLSLLGFAKSQDSTLIGFSLGDFDVDRWYKDVEYFTKEANKFGQKVLIEYAYGKTEKQNEQIISLINQGAKVIVVIPTDGEKLTGSIKACTNNNVKVLAYDRLIKNSNIDAYISFDNIKIGMLQATYVTELVPEGNYVLLAGPSKDNNAIGFYKGQKKVLKPFIEKQSISIVYEKKMLEWSSMEAFMEMESVTSNHTKIDVIIASNDQLAKGAIMAMENKDLYKNTLVTGQDATLKACKDIITGKQTMTIYKPIKKLAQAAAEQSYNLANSKQPTNITDTIFNGAVNVPSMLLDPVIVDKNNLKETVIKDGYFSVEELYGK